MLKKLLVPLLSLTLLLSGCSKKNANVPQPGDSKTPEPPARSELKALQLQPPASGEEIAVITTTMGVIKIRFFPEYAKKAVENFKTHSRNGYYNGLSFHRVINDFMIQGGDPNGTGSGGQSIWGKPFEDEFNPSLHNLRGALSMANSGPNTNGSQFFIVQAKSVDPKFMDALKAADRQSYPEDIVEAYGKIGGTPWLDYKHTVFGQIFEGMDVVDKIASVEVDENDKPVTPVKIVKIEIVKQK